MSSTTAPSDINKQPAHLTRQRPWAELEQRVAGVARTQAQRGIFRGLARRVATRPPDAEMTSAQLWAGLIRRVEIAEYRPRRIANVVEEPIDEDGQRFYVLRSPTGSYLRLSTAEREIWQAMDGSQSITQLAMTGFTRFKQLLPIADLVQNLRAQGFLADAPVGIYRQIRSQVEARGVEGFGQRILHNLRGRTFPIDGIDDFVGALYRYGGRLLFTRAFAIVHALITLIGLVCFGLMASGSTGSYTLLDTNNILPGLLTLWAALLLSFVFHELSHALAVKHFGRRVLRGGVMIYYGMPAAFVDTSDIWLAGRNDRVLVSLAGPLCDLLVGSLAAIAAFSLPSLGQQIPEIAGPAAILVDAAYKLALACYMGALFNFNPLLELDGYFILVDLLRLPNLRKRALEFISGPLWQKLHARATLDTEERIFTLYGLLSAAYTLVAIVLAAAFWQKQMVGIINRLWSDGPLPRMLALLIIVAVVVPIGLGLIFAAWGLVRAAAAWMARRGYARNPLLVASLLTLLALALAGLPLRYGLTVRTALIAPLLWIVALAAQIGLHTDYRGAWAARALDSFLAVTVIELIALSGYLMLPEQSTIWAALEIIGFVLLMFAGLVALLDVDLRQSQPTELTVSAILLVVAFLTGGLASGTIQRAQPDTPFSWAVIAAGPVYLSFVALALLMPQLASLGDSRLRWSWILLWLGIAAQTVSYLLEILPGWRNTPPALAALVLAAGLWAAAWCTHYVTLRRLSTRGLNWPLQPALSEAEQLRNAIQHCYAGCYRLLHEHYGARRAKALDDRMDVLAATANWDIVLDGAQVRISPLLKSQPLDVQGVRYAEVLRYTLETITEQAGASFARRVIRAAYDALPWPERETADRLIFPSTPWAGELSRSFGDARAARLRLLRQVELFAACDDNELNQLAVSLEERRVGAGMVLLPAGEAPRGLWIIDAGEVAVKDAGQVAGELHRGEFFGEVGGDLAAITQHAYITNMESSILYLPGGEVQRVLREVAPHTNEGIAIIETVQLLERVPLFAGLPRSSLRDLAGAAQQKQVSPRSVIVRQGVASGMFYLIAKGRAAVVRQSISKGGDVVAGPPKVVAQLGPGEFFGEIELLRNSPPMASVVSIEKMELVAIPHATIADMLTHSSGLARGLEQIGSGRIITLRG